MTKARRYQLAASASAVLAAAALLMRGTLPAGPADFASGFFAAIGAGLLFSAWLSADRTGAQ